MNVRILYHGLGMAGKTTNLEKLTEIYKGSVSERIHQKTSEGRTVYLDMVALSIKTKSGNDEVSIELFTTPGQERFRILRRWLFGHIDGIVLVLDSTRSLEENLKAYEELKSQGLDSLPMVVQLNKTDIGTLKPEDLKSTFRASQVIQAVAKDGIGVAETFKAILREVLNAKAHIG